MPAMQFRAGSGLYGAIELPLGNPVPGEELVAPAQGRLGEPQHKHEVGPGTTTRSRGRCAENALHQDRRSLNPFTATRRLRPSVGRSRLSDSAGRLRAASHLTA